MSDKKSIPTILFRFKHGPQLFRVVITAPYGGVVIERQERDGMGDPKWERVNPDLVDPAEMALLALAGRGGYTVEGESPL